MALKSKLGPNPLPVKERYKKTLKLLSGGYFNREAFPTGEVVVFPWSHETEEWLIPRVKKGNKNVLIDLIPQICSLNGADIKSLPMGEVQTILLFSRAIIRDCTLDLHTKCPACGHQQTESITVPDNLTKVGEKKSDYPGFDIITLPEIKDILKVHPFTAGDEMAVSLREDLTVKNIPDRYARIMSCIDTVNESVADSVQELFGYVRALGPTDFAFLEKKLDEINPHLSPILNVKCNSCGHEFEHVLRFDAQFFR